MSVTVTSRDGTPIAYEQVGSGPPLILVDGAFCHRGFGPMAALAARLSGSFRVVYYDRRGRGESGDAPEYDVQREVDDLRAIVDALGAEPFVYGTSSGAVLAARAVASGVSAKKLALYEPPLALDGTHRPEPADFVESIAAHVRAGRRAEAVQLFMRAVGVPRAVLWIMRLTPVFRKLTAVAHTLPYDLAILGDTQRGAALPDELRAKLRAIRVPTLVLAGGKSPDWMRHAARVVAEGVSGEHLTRILPGQDHNASAKAVAPALIEFFEAPAPRS